MSDIFDISEQSYSPADSYPIFGTQLFAGIPLIYSSTKSSLIFPILQSKLLVTNLLVGFDFIIELHHQFGFVWLMKM